jgi:Ca-activated chloride channel family protein
MESIEFDHVKLMYLLWAIPILGLVFAYGFARKSRALRRFATSHLLVRLIPQVSVTRQKLKAGLVLLALAALVVAATGPRWGEYWENVQRKGIDIMIVLDVSKSMLAEDVAPNRLERAKEELKDLVAALPGDRIGLVTFSGAPSLACPLTINYGAFRMVLDETSVRSAPRGGTLIGDAVRFAADHFVDRVKDHKAIILITDGEDHESYPVEAAQKAYEEKGIRLFTVGFGDVTQGQRIPVGNPASRRYLQYDGQEVWSKMNPATLQEMAVVSSGIYFPAGTSDIDFRDIYRRISENIRPREFEESKKQFYYARFQWFAGLALLLLMGETLLTDRKSAPDPRAQTTWWTA